MKPSIQIPWGLYCRIETLAGGTWANDRAFIRACRSKFKKQAKMREGRVFRREFYAAVFETRDRMRNQTVQFKL